MANRLGRYKEIYSKLIRPDNSSVHPLHVFLRAPSANGKTFDRKADRINCFEGTFVHLTERFKGKEVFLVGTVNQSSILAQRTQKLIQEIQPEVVLVQTNEQWWNTAKMLKYVDSQEEFSHYNSHLDKYTTFQSYNIWNPTRSPIFWARFYLQSALFKLHFQFPSNFTFLKPGLEMKYALEEADKNNIKVQFLGTEFCQVTWQRLIHETRMNLPYYLYKRFQYFGLQFWGEERKEFKARLHNSEPSQFSEKCLDRYQLNWIIQSLDIFFPKFKRIFIDMKDEDLFRAIDQSKSQKIVVVVNQWHMEGIENHWAHRYGQLPRSVQFPEGINPIGDMDLRDGLFQRLYNALHREIASANSKGTPSTYADWIIGYHRESNWQYEHRDM